MPFIRRFTLNPGSTILGNVASINIIDSIPSGPIIGISEKVIGIVGEFVKGPMAYSTTIDGRVLTGTLGPQTEGSVDNAKVDFGGFSAYIGDGDLSANGNGIARLSGLKWGELVIVRVNTIVGQVTFTLSGAIGTNLLIPAGSRVKASVSGYVYVTAQDATIVAGQTTVTVDISPANDHANASAATLINTVVDDPGGHSPATLSVSNALDTTAMTAALLKTAYTNAIGKTLVADGSPGSLITHIFSAREDLAADQPVTDTGVVEPIRNALISNAINFSNLGATARKAITGVIRGTSKAQALHCKKSSHASYGAGDDREYFEYVHAKWYSPDAQSILEIGPTSFMASVLANLPPWESPAQATPQTEGILGIESDLGVQYGVQDYIDFQAAGINALRIDPYMGPVFMADNTGVDPTVYPSLKRITRREMADYIETSIAVGIAPNSKKLSTPKRRDAISGKITEFLTGEQSPSDPDNSHLSAFAVDDKTANTPAILASGQFNILVSVVTYPALDAINLMAQIGENVVISETAPTP